MGVRHSGEEEEVAPGSLSSLRRKRNRGDLMHAYVQKHMPD